jgi:HB1, ASXL, restriction endonuclease HTH domain
MLAKRIQSYRDHEDRLRARIEEMQSERESVSRRRESAEELYEAEFRERYSETGEAIVVVDEFHRGPLTGLSWAEAMTRVLQEAGHPLHVKQIWEKLREDGFRTNARDPIRSVVAIAVRDPVNFPKVGPNRYGLRAAAQGTAKSGEVVTSADFDSVA